MKNNKKDKILIIGSGSIALKHFEILNKSFDVYFLSKNSNVKNIINKKKIYKSRTEIRNSKFIFAIIANQTYDHLNAINWCVKKKINIYCEKPIYHKKFNFKNLRNIIIKNKIFFICGYQLRMDDKINYIKEILKKNKPESFQFQVGHNILNWRKKPTRVHSYYIDTKKGGGCINELVHEINLIQYLFGKIVKIKSYNKFTSRFNFKCEEFATSVIETEKHQIGTLYQDIFSPILFRKLLIVCKKKLIEYDMAQNNLIINKKKINLKTSNNQTKLIKSKLMFFKNLIKKNKFTIKHYDESVQDLIVIQKMHEK